MGEREVSWTGGTLAVRDLGGPGPDVLLLHGAGGNLEHWWLVTPRLAGACRMVLVDLPAHGRSGVPGRYAFDDDLAAVHAVCRALDLETPVVVGHSYGGMLAVALGARNPGGYRVVVNVDGIGFVHHATPPELSQLWREHDEEEVEADSGDEIWRAGDMAVDERWLRTVGVTDDLPPEVLGRGYRRTPDGVWHRSPPLSYHLALLREIRGVDLLEVYRSTRCRTVTVLVERREAPTPEVAASWSAHVAGIREALHRLPSSSPARTVVDVPGGHAVPFEQPDVLSRIVMDLLD